MPVIFDFLAGRQRITHSFRFADNAARPRRVKISPRRIFRDSVLRYQYRATTPPRLSFPHISVSQRGSGGMGSITLWHSDFYLFTQTYTFHGLALYMWPVMPTCWSIGSGYRVSTCYVSLFCFVPSRPTPKWGTCSREHGDVIDSGCRCISSSVQTIRVWF